jgi:hypothetical protein
LGYTSFTDTTLNHKYADLDGKTAIGSRGAAIAATKGMIICNSAGNEGDDVWHYIGVPADAPGVVAVGAVDDSTHRATFSSFGPTADGRIKPDLVAPGDDVLTAGSVGLALTISSGTSLASPMLAGAIAALWSAYPDKTAQEILQAVYQTADQAEHPDNERGYGLPDMTAAWQQLGGFTFNRETGELTLPHADRDFTGNDRVDLRSMAGLSVGSYPAAFTRGAQATIKIRGLATMPPGAYQLLLHDGPAIERIKVLLWN